MELSPVDAPPLEALLTRVLLVGDAGEIGASTLNEVASWAGQDPDSTVTLFLGDNMYPEGMTSEHQGEADLRLLPQIHAATDSGAQAVFVPGNHDWADGGDEGYEAILAQADYVNSRMPGGAGFVPSGGCPGPVAMDQFRGLRIIVVDTQWWLHGGEKPGSICAHRDTAAVVTAFAALLDTDRHVVIAAHHPMFGYGRHAGFSDWRDHLTPPVIGSLIALGRKLPLRIQDYNSSQYQTMMDAFHAALRQNPGQGGMRVWVAGHEHSLQVLDGFADDSLDYVLISGSAAKTSPVNHGDETIFAQSRPGFMVLEFFSDARVLVRVVEATGGEVFQFWLGDR